MIRLAFPNKIKIILYFYTFRIIVIKKTLYLLLKTYNFFYFIYEMQKKIAYHEFHEKVIRNLEKRS